MSSDQMVSVSRIWQLRGVRKGPDVFTKSPQSAGLPREPWLFTTVHNTRRGGTEPPVGADSSDVLQLSPWRVSRGSRAQCGDSVGTHPAALMGVEPGLVRDAVLRAGCNFQLYPLRPESLWLCIFQLLKAQRSPDVTGGSAFEPRRKSRLAISCSPRFPCSKTLVSH